MGLGAAFLLGAATFGLAGCDGAPAQNGSNASTSTSTSTSASPTSKATSASSGPIDTAALSAAEMEAEVLAAIGVRDTLDRVSRRTELMQGVRRENVEGAKNALDQDMVRLEQWEIRLFAAAYARLAPEEAMDYVRTWTFPKHAATALDEIIYGWTLAGGGEDVVEYAERTIIEPALAERKEQAGEVGRIALPTEKNEFRPNYIVSTMVRALAVAGKGDEVTRILTRYPISDKSTMVLSSAVIGFRRHGTEPLENWIMSIPTDAPNDVYARVWNSAIGVQAKMDASVSARWYESAEENFDPEQGPLQGWTRDWARKDPVAAISWMLERADTRDRLEAIRAAALQWLKADGPAASAWLRKEMDRPGLKPAALFPLTQYMMTVDVEESIALAEDIPNVREKNRALKQSLMALAGRDPQAFKRYAEGHEIPQKVLDTIEAHHGPKLRAIGMPRLDRKG